jgi:hypothetical protein
MVYAGVFFGGDARREEVAREAVARPAILRNARRSLFMG